MDWLRKLQGFSKRRTMDADLDEEIRTHLDMKTADARDPAAARRQFGNAALHLQDAREAWRWPRLDDWLRDLRYALRAARRRPGFTATVMLTLGLAIGSASTIYTLIDAVIIRPLPYPGSGRLVALYETRRNDERGRAQVSPGRIEDWQRMSSTLESVAGSYGDTVTDTSGGAPERIPAAYVSPRFFTVMGAPPALGRVFTPEEERFGGPMTVVLSDAFWRRRFAANPDAIGQMLAFGGARYTIIGVMSPAFRYPSPMSEIWVAKQARPDLLKIREARFYFGVGRLKPGATIAQAASDLEAMQRRLIEQYPKSDTGWGTAIEPLKRRIVGNSSGALWILAAAVTVLLLIGCANVACLLLARLQTRASEIATRRSLGAGRGAIARQLFSEGLVYSLGGAALGLAAAFGGAEILRARLSLPRIAELRVDARMLALVMVTSLFSALLFSLAPILQTLRRDLAAGWLRSGRGIVGGGLRLPRALVASQFALAAALLIGAGLFLRSLTRLEEAPLGFRAEGVYTFHVGASFSERPDAVVTRHQRILDALAGAPGVISAAMSVGLPAANPAQSRDFQIVGEASPGGAPLYASFRTVTASYFDTLSIPMLRGRTCRMNTAPQQPFEAIVNRAFADRYLRGRDPIGRTVVQGTAAGMPIVGVVADVKEDGPGVDAPPVIYACGYLRFWPDSDFVVRHRHSDAIASAVRAVDPSSPIYGARPLDEAVSSALDQTRFRVLVVTVFSGLALALAAIGLYGVMAYAVSQRSREFGIRMALGARQGQILAGVLRSGAALALAGAAGGLALGAAGARAIGTFLYDVHPLDVVSYAGAVLALFVVAVLACLIPARRAVSIHPTDALRES